jgi:hypothetical protein
MLSEAQILALVDGSESRLVERKISMPNGGAVRRTLVAFANSVAESEHAVLFIGIGDGGVKNGVHDPDKVQRDVRRIAENDCYPPVHCEPCLVKVSGVEIVAIVVPFSTNRPHFAGHAYVRRGSESVKASKEVFEEMILSRNDKVRKILAERGKPISVQFTGNKKPSLGLINIPLEFRSYRIDQCDAHVVKFIDTNFGNIYSPSLEHVAIGFDSSAQRFKLIVKEDI